MARLSRYFNRDGIINAEMSTLPNDVRRQRERIKRVDGRLFNMMRDIAREL